MATAVIMPKFGMAQEEATVIAWLYADGDRVEKGAPILEVETDKTTMEVEAPASGVLRILGVEMGDRVPVTQVIAYILKPGEPMPGPGDSAPVRNQPGKPRRVTPVARRMAAAEGIDLDRLPIPSGRAPVSRRDIEQALAARAGLAPGDPHNVPRPRATPAARRLARALGLELAAVTGRGPRGRIQAADILSAAEGRPSQPEIRPPAAGMLPGRLEPLTTRRQTIAARMTQSYQATPHFTLTVDADMAAALALVDPPARPAAGDHPPITITALLVKVCAWALTRHPRVNASFQKDGLYYFSHANIGVAVALDEGLIVPVIHQAEAQPLAAIAARLEALAAAARQGALKPDDVYGGTFTISNLGMYGVRQFSAIINPPQSAILAVGALTRQPVAIETDRGEAIEIRPRMALTLSLDHRVLDGALGAVFLQDVVAALEDPSLLPD